MSIKNGLLSVFCVDVLVDVSGEVTLVPLRVIERFDFRPEKWFWCMFKIGLLGVFIS